MIYARALTEVFENNEDPRNGSAVLKRITNRSYRSIQGYDVSMSLCSGSVNERKHRLCILN